MKNKIQKAFITLFFVFLSGTLFGLFAADSHAYERYNDGCQNCHGAFFDGTSPKGTIFNNQGNKLEMHRTPYDMETDCHMCHKNGDKNNPYIGKSAGHHPVPGLGCTGCHGREADAGHDSISDGLGAGLRQHHWNADSSVDTDSGPLSSRLCADCHSDSDPANYSPVGEHVIPPYYGTAYTNADNPCNEVPQHNMNENWDDFNLEGLDNDGDGLYDMDDPDCITDSLTVINNTPLATSANAHDSNVEMQRMRLDCSRDGDELCVITAVTVHDTEVSSTGVIDSVKIYIDDDQNFQNGTLDNVRVNNWDGEPTVVDLASSIAESHRTVGEQGNRYILLIYNVNAESGGYDIQSEVTAIDVEYPDNGVSGSWGSSRVTIDGTPCIDNDNDGYSPEGGTCGLVDCNDDNSAVHPNAEEACDGLDNDCNGTADDIIPQATTCGLGECSSTGQTTCIGGVEGDTCDPFAGATPEVCDDAGVLDEDCDGLANGNDPECSCVPTGVPDDNCDGIDDDCDGSIDEDYIPTATTCGTGECFSTGQTTCIGGVEGDTCTPGTPSAELCDGLDNNCDGSTDEAFSNLNTSCTAGVGACEATGSYVCTADGSGTECNATPGLPGTEGPQGDPSCTDTVDNDCDGVADSADIDCQGCTDADNDGYYTGEDECGTKDCNDNNPAINPGAEEICGDNIDNDCDNKKDDKDPEGCVACTPTGTAETACNGIDDDCDGQIDEDFIPAATSCGTGECASTGQTTCSGGIEGDTCTAGTPSAELCDNLDNNCDGSIDENVTRPTTCGVGECGATGIETCTAGTWGGDTCTPGVPSAEVCDNLDNNCNGSIDENVTRSTTCGVGECAGNTGEETCTAGSWGGDTCDPFAGATPEVCDDAGVLDEDCDGLANGNDPECSCVPTGVPDDNCDGIDDDCDGTPDDEYVSVQCGSGACAASSLCTDGVEAPCQPEPPIEPSDVTCDGIDGDCDGQIDEDYVVDDTCGAGICQTSNIPSSCVSGIETPCQEGTPTETPEATCDDGVDNDCDGQTDGLDNNCGGAYIPPPVRQAIGIPDSAYNNFVEADCRFCHENPDQFPVDDETIPNRHHLLVDMQVLFGTCSLTTTTQCQNDAECPVSEFCINGSDAPFPPPPGEVYECLTCHEAICGAECTFIVERDCMACHIQNPVLEYTVHHRTDLAQGVLPQGPDCQFCHGSIVDNRDDGHVISTSAPTDQTPKRSGGTGLPFNSRGNGAGACDYCHNNGTSPEAILVETNEMTHHNRGFGFDDTKCDWCHAFTIPFQEQIRICENCHGFNTLHNIQADSDGDGIINPGTEQPFYGHIGNADDCWGCHGFGPATAPETGPIIPTINGMSSSVLTEGTHTTVAITGTAFTNMDQDTELLSDVELTAEDGTSTTLTPDSISQGSITVTIPGTLSAGRYRVKAVKQGKFSNPKVITIEPAVTINDIHCSKQQGILTITGSGFGQKPVGSDAYINVEVNSQIADPLSWSDTEITVSVSNKCKGLQTVTVNALFGSATW